MQLFNVSEARHVTSKRRRKTKITFYQSGQRTPPTRINNIMPVSFLLLVNGFVMESSKRDFDVYIESNTTKGLCREAKTTFHGDCPEGDPGKQQIGHTFDRKRGL